MSRERDYDRPREEAPAEPNPEFKCFIGGIPFSVDDGKLRDGEPGQGRCAEATWQHHPPKAYAFPQAWGPRAGPSS